MQRMSRRGLGPWFSLAVILAAPAAAHAGPGVWTTGGPFDATISQVVIDPGNPSTLYALTPNSGIFKSTDSGGVWTATNNGLGIDEGRPSPRMLVIDPVTPTTLYACGFDGVYKSTNGGVLWAPANTGFPYPWGTLIDALAIDPSAPNTLYGVSSKSALQIHGRRGNMGLRQHGRLPPVAIGGLDLGGGPHSTNNSLRGHNPIRATKVHQ